MKRLIIVTICLLSSLAFGDEKLLSSEDFQQHETVIMKELLEGKQFKSDKEINKDPLFCDQLIKDFVAQKDITYIQPIAQADKFDDPALAPYNSYCPNRPMHMIYYYTGGKDYQEGLREAPSEQEIEENGLKYYATNHMKLYEVDIDNNPENGKEYVFYGEDYFSQQKKDIFSSVEKQYYAGWDQSNLGHYSLVKFQNCPISHEIQGAGIWVKPEERKSFYHHTGIIEKDKKSYTYTIYGYDESGVRSDQLEIMYFIHNQKKSYCLAISKK